jgi:ribulose-phosphate 3-epimerase
MASIEHIKAYGFEAGVAVKPETTLEKIGATGYEADTMFFLSVPPGKQGQKFMPEVLEKIKLFKEKHPHVPIALDGGVHLPELQEIKKLNLDYVVMGSEIFSHPDPGAHLKKLQKLILS